MGRFGTQCTGYGKKVDL